MDAPSREDRRPVRPPADAPVRERRATAPPPLPLKLCGIARPEDAELALELRPWALGLVLAERSPRRCRDEAAQEIAAMTNRRAELAGVFVDEKLDRVVRLADRYGLTIVQLHGSEGPAYAETVAARTGCRVIRAQGIRAAVDVRDLGRYRVDYHLLDRPKDASGRATGDPKASTWDWSLVRHHRGDTPFLTAGGLTVDNVADAITATRPFAVDVASGVESSPGVKDPALVRELAAIVRETAPPMRLPPTVPPQSQITEAFS